MYKTKGLRLIIVVYWILLIYILAALVWWFISLQQQNNSMTELLINELYTTDVHYQEKVNRILEAKSRKNAQYIGEGATFLVLILVGAVFVYRATRRQLLLSHQQQNFMMAVTHELKTPIAVTRLNLETLQRRRFEEAQQQKLISVTLQEVNRLNTLCNNILLASQLDAGEYKIAKNEVDLSNLVKRVFNDFTARFPARKLEGSFEDGLCVSGEELLLEMLMTNLIDNALKYSPKDSAVVVALSKSSNCILFSVKDEGPGIVEEEQSKIFDKFYRIGNETTRTAKGTGLGLYLCKQIARDHNADIKVKNSDEKGAVFTVTFKV